MAKSMKLTEIGAGIADLIISEEQSRPRSPGLHVSDVIKYMRKALGKDAEWGEDELETASQLGRIWERIVAEVLASSSSDDARFARPGTVLCDGISGSPDGIDFEDGAILEYKCTWRSCNRDIELSFPHYWYQIKAYCYMVGVNIGRLYVLFINGDYRGGGPVFKAWEARFTELELRENWEMILAQAKDMKRGNQKRR